MVRGWVPPPFRAGAEGVTAGDQAEQGLAGAPDAFGGIKAGYSDETGCWRS